MRCVFVVGLVSMICMGTSGSGAQERPRSPVWLGASVGFGSLYVGEISASGPAADLGAGLRVGNLRTGIRILGVSSMDIGDQPGWSGRTLLGVVGHDFADGLLALTIGAGSTRVRQKDSPIRGRSTVLKTGVEVGLTRCPGISVQLSALQTWALNRTRWEQSTLDFGNATQFHLGLGLLTC